MAIKRNNDKLNPRRLSIKERPYFLFTKLNHKEMYLRKLESLGLL